MTAITYAAAQLLRVLPRTQITRAVGRLCDANIPPAALARVVDLYVRAYDVALDEAADKPPYASFDAFFTRALVDGARTFDANPLSIVSPADGKIASIGTIEKKGRITAKGTPYLVSELVGDEAESERFDGGHFAVVYLSPRDYHRVHTPIAGKIAEVRSLPGDYFPVNSIGEKHVDKLFSVNRRVAICIDTEARGRVTVVMVSAMIVGRISVSGVPGRDVPIGTHRLEPAREVARGDEIGRFHLGSTAVVLVEKKAGFAFTRAPGPIRLGETLGEVIAPGTSKETR